MNRRAFLATVGRTTGGLVVLSVPSCSGGTGPASALGPTGAVNGLVVDLQGSAVPSLGRVILMLANGRQTGRSDTPGADARFRFDDLAPGDYQIRFHAPGQAFVPEPYPHPMRFTVEAGRTTELHVPVRIGPYNVNTIEIYCGDGFFQLQPDGAENGEAVVSVGTNVCWYNVGLTVHSVTGGPWVDSGDLQRAQAYLWTANQKGFFGYQCKHHGPEMKAVLRVV